MLDIIKDKKLILHRTFEGVAIQKRLVASFFLRRKIRLTKLLSCGKARSPPLRFDFKKLQIGEKEVPCVKVMYTTNAIESINSVFRKVTKKGSFPSEDSVMKALYLRITELYKKWNGRSVSNWAMVRNQLSMDDKIQAQVLKYENF